MSKPDLKVGQLVAVVQDMTGRPGKRLWVVAEASPVHTCKVYPVQHVRCIRVDGMKDKWINRASLEVVHGDR